MKLLLVALIWSVTLCICLIGLCALGVGAIAVRAIWGLSAFLLWSDGQDHPAIARYDRACRGIQMGAVATLHFPFKPRTRRL